jgi:hypothetical protein
MAIAVTGFSCANTGNTVGLTAPSESNSIIVAIIEPTIGGVTTSVKTAPKIDGVDMDFWSIGTFVFGWAVYYTLSPTPGARTMTAGEVNYSGGYSNQKTLFYALTGVHQTYPFRTSYSSVTTNYGTTQGVTSVSTANDMILSAAGGYGANHGSQLYVTPSSPAGLTDLSGFWDWNADGPLWGSHEAAYCLSSGNDALAWSVSGTVNGLGQCIALRPAGQLSLGAITPTGAITLRAIWHHLFGGITPTGNLVTTKYSYHSSGISGTIVPIGRVFVYKIRPFTLYAPYVPTTLNAP